MRKISWTECRNFVPFIQTLCVWIMITAVHVRTRKIAGTERTTQKSEMEYFEEFFELQNNQPMNEEQSEVSRLIRKLQEV